MASDKELNIGIKVTSDTAGAKQATAAIDGVDKAVADLSKTEKEATNINGMYLDSLGRIHDESGRFVKVSAEERAGLKERIKIQQQDTVATNGAVQAKKELGKANGSAALGVMALSNAFQDIQYGMAGAINNIPQIVSHFGFGMGVAGVAQAAAVGVQILTKNVDLFGEKAKQAARDAADLSAETMADANAAYRSAEATKAMTAAQERHNEAMNASLEQYKESIALSEQLIKQRQAEKDAETALADAEAAHEMARIALAEATGQMTKEAAIFAKDKARVEAEARKQTAAIALEETKIAEARRKAAAEQALATSQRGMALQYQGEGAGLMSKDDLELASKNKKAAQDLLSSSQLRQADIAKKLKDQQFGRGSIENSEKIERLNAENRAKLAKEREEEARLQADIERENTRLLAHEAAIKRAGVDTREKLNEKVKAEFDAAKAAEQRAGGFTREAAAGEAGIVQSQRIFGLRQSAGSISALAQVEAERTKQREEAEKERERAAKEAEREANRRATNLKQVGAAGGSLASTLAGDGLAPGFADSLREAAGGAGDAAGLNRLMKMVAMLTTNTKKLSEQAKSKLDKLEAEIEDLRTAK